MSTIAYQSKHRVVEENSPADREMRRWFLLGGATTGLVVSEAINYTQNARMDPMTEGLVIAGLGVVAGLGEPLIRGSVNFAYDTYCNVRDYFMKR